MNKKGLKVLFLLWLSILESCTTSPSKTGLKDGQQQRPTDTSKLIPKSAGNGGPDKSGKGIAEKVIPVDPDCVQLSSDLQDLPKFFAKTGVFITEFIKVCKSPEGKLGIKSGSPWSALGFPCTGGKGEFDWKGSEYAPKLANFDFENSCPMLISSQKEVEERLRSEISIPSNSHLIAYYPFSVVYWELPQFGDSDAGYTIELYSGNARKDGWTAFQAKKPLYVRLFGRENALVRTDNLYQVDGYIKIEGEHDFRFYVETVKLLDDESKNILKRKCENLKPRRRCDELF